MNHSNHGMDVPDTKLGRAVTEFVRDTESDLLFNHSSRVYCFGALAGQQRSLTFDPELLYTGAMFHDIGLVPGHGSSGERFEVDGANASKAFLESHGIAQADIATVWAAIALHTTPGIPQHMHPVIALVTVGVEMDVLGLRYGDFADGVREAVVSVYPRGERFKEHIIQAFHGGFRHKPETTFGTVNADVMADKEPHFHSGNFCSGIRESRWND